MKRHYRIQIFGAATYNAQVRFLWIFWLNLASEFQGYQTSLEEANKLIDIDYKEANKGEVTLIYITKP